MTFYEIVRDKSSNFCQEALKSLKQLEFDCGTVTSEFMSDLLSRDRRTTYIRRGPAGPAQAQYT